MIPVTLPPGGLEGDLTDLVADRGLRGIGCSEGRGGDGDGGQAEHERGAQSETMGVHDSS